jgi:hypothetical protein
MALTKEVLGTYRDGLVNERDRTLANLHAITGALQVVDKMLRYLELEASGTEAVSLADVGLEQPRE